MSEGSRLSRWSQRKLASRQIGTRHGGALPEPDEPDKSPVDVAARDLRDSQQPELSAQMPKSAGAETKSTPDGDAALPDGEQMLTEADLPPIGELTAQSDYTVFLKKNVPEVLRRQALRKLWVSDPVLANLDGLNDYDDDYTLVTAMTMDDTSYKIGRGFLEDSDLKPEIEPEPKLAQADTDIAKSEFETETEESESPAGTGEPEQATAAAGDENGGGKSDAPPAAVSDASRRLGIAEPERAAKPGVADDESVSDIAS